MYGRLDNVSHSFKDAHTLIPRKCKYITSHGKGGFSDVVKGKDLEMGRISWIILVGPIESYKSLKVWNLSGL